MKANRSLIIGLSGLVGIGLMTWCVAPWLLRVFSAPTPIVGLEHESPLQKRLCHYRTVGDVAIACYWFRTEEGFRLPVAVFTPHRKLVETPLVYFAGGPGEESNTGEQALEFWNYWYLDTIPTRDFILFDYRGAEEGSPAWDCHRFTEVSRLGMQRKVEIKAGYQRASQVLHDCFIEWDAFLRSNLLNQYQPGEAIRLFSSASNAGDAIGIVDALGYENWHALGASYGTRVALVAAAKDPGLEKLVLDGPYPPGSGDVVDTTRVWLESLKRFWQGCAAGHICQPTEIDLDPEILFWQAMERLRSKPITLTVDNWHATGAISLLVDDVRLLQAISGALYSRESRAMIIPTIKSLLHGEEPSDPSLFEQLYNYAFDPDFNSMLYFATECTDNELLDEAQFSEVLEGAGRLRRYLQWDWQFDVCRNGLFTSKRRPAFKPQSVQALVISGEYDPVTPPEYGRWLMDYLPNGQHIELPYGAHAEFVHGDCGRHHIAQFLDGLAGSSNDGDISAAISACLKQNVSP